MDEARVSARARVTIVPAPEFWQMMEFCQAQDQVSTAMTSIQVQ